MKSEKMSNLSGGGDGVIGIVATILVRRAYIDDFQIGKLGGAVLLELLLEGETSVIGAEDDFLENHVGGGVGRGWHARCNMGCNCIHALHATSID